MKTILSTLSAVIVLSIFAAIMGFTTGYFYALFKLGLDFAISII